MLFFVEIAIVFFGIALLILFCRCVKKSRDAQGSSMTRTYSPSVYIIPIYQEEQESEEETDIHDTSLQLPYGPPSVYSSRNVIPPPPYVLEPPSYADPPPPYAEVTWRSHDPPSSSLSC